MIKKLHFLVIVIILLNSQIGNAQTSNIPDGIKFKQQIKNKVLNQNLSENGIRADIPAGSKVLNYVQGGTGVDLNPLLSNMGFTVTYDTATYNLNVSLPSDQWDLVVIQIHADYISDDERTAISDYVSTGGKLILFYWALDQDPALQTLLGISNTVSFNSPFPVSVWESSHPIFNSPYPINDLAVDGDNGGYDNGDKLEPSANGIALAGFVGNITTDEAAIILANNSNTIVHGFGGIDMDQSSFLNLVTNEAEFLISYTAPNVLNHLQGGFGIDLNNKLTAMGYAVTNDIDYENLDTMIPSLEWDLIILQIHSDNITPEERTAIIDYVTAGGKIIISYWNLNNDPDLQAILGVSNAISFNTPFPVSVWNPTHSIFNNPNTINDIAVIGDNSGSDNGDKLEPDENSTALAGFVTSTTANEAAIILSNDDKAIVHGFAGADMDLTTFLNLIENEAKFISSRNSLKILNGIQGGDGVNVNAMLTDRGYNVTNDFSYYNFDTSIAAQDWDVVILQIHSDYITPEESTAISNYVAGGGKLILSYWNLNNESILQSLLGVTNTISFETPIPVSVWNSGHSIFNNPNVISGLTVIGDNAGNDNGDKLEPDANSEALAGFVASTTTNEAAIVLSNNNATILHGFAGADMNEVTFLKLIENEVVFLVEDDALSIENSNIQLSNLVVYPNPTKGIVNIDLGMTYNHVKISVFNVLGEKTETTEYTSTNKINDFNIKGNSGIYFINIETGKGNFKSFKLIKI